MAGRPAAGRGGGLTGLHYGLITFVILFVLALAGFIWVFTVLKGYQDEADKATGRLNDFGTPPSYYVQEAGSRRSTVAAVMDENLRSYGNLVTGDPEAVWPAAEQAANAQLAQTAATHAGTLNPGDTLLTAVQRLHEGLSQAKLTNAGLLAELQTVQDENRSLKEGIKAAQDQFEAQVAALEERVAQLDREKSDALAAKDEQLNDLRTTLEDNTQETNRLRQDWVGQRRTKDLEIGRLQTHVSELQKKIQALKPTSLDPAAILTKADGRIMRAIPGSDVVYINLGSDDKIKPGMGFEVFSRTHEPREGLRGKASIEVTTVMPSTAECRVTRVTPGEPIVEEDVCVNIAYERGRLPKFVVRGEFDLNYDGIVDFDGIERVTAIINQWGGQVVPELDETIDFVVIGARPQAPEIASGERVSAVVEALAEDKRLARQRFGDLVGRATAMYIPVITQNQFLFLTGYVGDWSSLPR
jgi:hypothetical protein